jgi:hypothetical protein
MYILISREELEMKLLRVAKIPYAPLRGGASQRYHALYDFS